MLADESQVLSRLEGLQAQNVNLVAGLDLLIILRVGESQSEHTLLLQVGFVDTGERASDDSETTEETRFESSVFTG